MTPKEELKTLILELYPSKSYRQSTIKCCDDTKSSYETVYKMTKNSCDYPVRQSFLQLLILKRELKEFKDKTKNGKYDFELAKEIEELKNKISEIESDSQELISKIIDKESLVKRNYTRIEEKATKLSENKKDISVSMKSIEEEIDNFNTKTKKLFNSLHLKLVQ